LAIEQWKAPKGRDETTGSGRKGEKKKGETLGEIKRGGVSSAAIRKGVLSPLGEGRRRRENIVSPFEARRKGGDLWLRISR